MRNAYLQTVKSCEIARMEAAAARAHADSTAEELASARARVEVLTKELRLAKEASRGLEAQLMEAKREAVTAVELAEGLEVWLEGAILRGDRAEAREREATEEAERSKEEASRAKAEAQTARDKAARAVDSYRSSTDFADEVTKAACNAFLKGFKECKNKISWAFNITDLTPKDSEEPTDATVGATEGGDDAAEAGGSGGHPSAEVTEATELAED